MKQFIQIVIFAVIFLIVPMKVSTSSDIQLTPEQEIDYRIRAKKFIIRNEIKSKYKQFYEELDKTTSPCYVHNFFERVMPEAIESKALPSVSIAQAALETGYGKYNKLQNNLFGIKGRGITTKTKEFYKGKFITIRANFQYFPTIKDAFNRHYQILNRYGVYGNNYNVWIDRIKACGYATDPNYDKKLKYIIDRYNLHILDEIQMLEKKCVNLDKEERNQIPTFTYTNI
jgi:flagellum-specific peptidoglycan hydrolase FlgJ